jgi:hypothetical protein
MTASNIRRFLHARTRGLFLLRPCLPPPTALSFDLLGLGEHAVQGPVVQGREFAEGIWPLEHTLADLGGDLPRQQERRVEILRRKLDGDGSGRK